MFPEGHSLKVFVGVLVTFILSSLFVAARLVSRFGIVKRHGWDDYTIIVAWVSGFLPETGTEINVSVNPVPRLWHVLCRRLLHFQRPRGS
jgi:hypothetical protein